MEFSRRSFLKKTGGTGAGAVLGLGGASIGTAAEKPSVNWRPADSSNYTSASRGASDINWIVIHVTQGSYEGAISWLQNPDANASAHYVLRNSDGDRTQMVRDDDIAWHAGNWTYNKSSIGIEHEGYVGETEFTDALYKSSAKIVRYLADEYNIPLEHPTGVAPCDGSDGGIIGHDQIPNPDNCSEGGGSNGHTDPGSTWDWDKFMSYIKDGTGGGGGSDVCESSWYTNDNVYALAKVIMSESSVGNDAEKRAVGYTVLNRMSNQGTDSVRDVWDAYAHNQEPTSGIKDLARSILRCEASDETQGATYFYSPRSMPAEGEDIDGYNTAGGLEWVPELDERHYKPDWGNEFKRIYIDNVRPAYFKFFVSEQSNDTPDCSNKLCVGDSVEVIKEKGYAHTKPYADAEVHVVESKGTKGTIVDGVTSSEGYNWWKIVYDTGTVGYTVEHRLGKKGGGCSDGLCVGDKVHVTAEELNVREGAGTGQDVIRSVVRYTTGKIVDGPASVGGDTWWKVEFDDDYGYNRSKTTGWCHGGYLSKGGVSCANGRCVEDSVHVTARTLNVRPGPGTENSPYASEPKGMMGKIVDGPREVDGTVWWGVEYDDGSIGWSSGTYLDEGKSCSWKHCTRDTVYVSAWWLSVRKGPGTDYSRITSVSKYTTGTIMAGPIWNDGYYWWKVKYDNGVTGWSAQNWLE